MHDYEAEQFEKYLNAAYDELVKMGFSFSKRTSWPVHVNLNNRQSDKAEILGEFTPSKRGDNYSYITFNFGNMPNEALMKSTAGHELFHLVQALYDPRWAFTKAISAGPLYWLDEATATWFEEVMAGKGYSSPTRKSNELHPFVGIYKGPTVHPQNYGYGMAAFIKYLVGQNDNKILSKIYEKRLAGAYDPVSIINEVSQKSISDIYPYFIEEYIAKKIYPDFDSYHMLWGIDYSGVQRWIVASKGDTLKTFDNDYPGISAKVFRLILSYEGFKDDDMLKVETDNTVFVPKYVYEAKNKELKFLYMGKSEFSIPNLKKLQKESGQILVVVANAGYTEDKVKTTFRIQSPPPKAITLTTAKAVGEYIRIRVSVVPNSELWIDINNNGKKDVEEILNSSNDYWVLGSQTVRIYGDVTYLNVIDEKLTSIDASGCKTLTQLICWNNQLTSLNVSGCTALKDLQCFQNVQLSSFDVSGCTALENLICYDNQIPSLDVSGFSALKRLECHYNRLTSLNVNGCTALEWLGCEDNQLTSLNVSGCTALKWLGCKNNRLTSLNVDGCPSLEGLNCSGNNLSGIRPAIFDKIQIVRYDIRYEYTWDNQQKKYVLYRDNGKGYWYSHEPEGGCHRPNPCNT